MRRVPWLLVLSLIAWIGVLVILSLAGRSDEARVVGFITVPAFAGAVVAGVVDAILHPR